jgi:hypothetical protein
MQNLMTEIKETIGNKIFSVSFVKKDGTLREMVCRFGVTKYLKGGEMNHDPKDYGHLVVFDMKKEAYRTINFNTIKQIKFEGKTYKFEVNNEA